MKKWIAMGSATAIALGLAAFSTTAVLPSATATPAGEETPLLVAEASASSTAEIVASGSCGAKDDVNWTLNSEGELRIFGNGTVDRYVNLSGSGTGYGWEDYAQQVERIVVEPGVIKIGGFGAMGNHAKELYIPTTVTSIYGSCVSWDNGYLTVYYAGTEEQWSQVEISDGNAGLLAATMVYHTAAPVGSLTFSDVSSDAYYAKPVQWAVEQGITSGTGANTFSPDKTCTRAEIVTFLWKAFGSEEPTVDRPYLDVYATTYGTQLYYIKPAYWVYEKGIYTGEPAYGETQTWFNGEVSCTRRDVAVYLWKAAGSPAGYTSNFSDVSPSDSEAVQAIGWAVAQGITNGVGNNCFNPNATCTRAEIVTFLYRDLA
jgi:hypothetical protein